MNTIEKQFKRMGAEVVLDDQGPLNDQMTKGRNRIIFSNRIFNNFSLNVRGEKFVISGDLKNQDIKVLDVRPKDKHLLLMRLNKGARSEKDRKEKFLCGHDERHWFVAAVPGQSVKNVPDAMDALKPKRIKSREHRLGVSNKDKKSRRNAASKRQGEWFFMPVGRRMKIDSLKLLKNEPIQRGRSKPHICEFLYREGGQVVYVNREYPNGLLEREYKELVRKNPQKKKDVWNVMKRNARVFVRGKIKHPDHKTLDLGDRWHEVQMNLENEAPGTQQVAFLD